MNKWFFLIFHLASLAFCIFTTWATMGYIRAHKVVPKERYLLFGFMRFRYVAFIYVLLIASLSIYSLLEAFT